MFLIVALIFIAFTVFYSLFSAAIIYHLRQFALPDSRTPHLVITAFIALGSVFWLLALYILFQMPG